MRKIKLVPCVLILLVVILLSGCGKNANDNENETKERTTESPSIEEPIIRPTPSAGEVS